MGAADLASGAVTATKIAAGAVQQTNLSFTPGTVTSVTAGTGLTGGTITATGTIVANIGTTAGTVAAGDHNHDDRYWSLTGNSNTDSSKNFLGTTDNQEFDLRVNGSCALRLVPNGTAAPNLIGGFSDNYAFGATIGATIAGGGFSGHGNRVTADYGAVGGGGDNQAGDSSGQTTMATYATVGGGESNTASAKFATVGGGYRNQASSTAAAVGQGATVGGGLDNTAAGSGATVAGGLNNIAGPLPTPPAGGCGRPR